MGVERTCAVWVLALSAAACSNPARQLGEEGTGSTGTAAHDSGTIPMGDSGVSGATGGAGNQGRDAGANPQGSGGGSPTEDAGSPLTGGAGSLLTDAGVSGGQGRGGTPIADRGTLEPAAGQGGSPEPVIDGGCPEGGAEACVPNTVYGPMPCTDDEQCIEDDGEGWYCDESNFSIRAPAVP